MDGPFLDPWATRSVCCYCMLFLVSVLSPTAAAFVLCRWLLRKCGALDDRKDNAILNSHEQTMRDRCYLYLAFSQRYRASCTIVSEITTSLRRFLLSLPPKLTLHVCCDRTESGITSHLMDNRSSIQHLKSAPLLPLCSKMSKKPGRETRLESYQRPLLLRSALFLASFGAFGTSFSLPLSLLP